MLRSEHTHSVSMYAEYLETSHLTICILVGIHQYTQNAGAGRNLNNRMVLTY